MTRYRSTLWSALALATLLVGAGGLEPLARGGDGGNGVGSSEALAEAIRSCELERARKILEPGGQGVEPGLVLGLAAEACGSFAAGLEGLRSAAEDSEFEDWRLLAIARTSIQLGQYSVAESALGSMRERHPDSPLSEEALLAAVELARERADPARIVELARTGRTRITRAATSEAVEVAAWEAAIELQDPQLRRESAVRLLSEHPIAASKLKVIEEFRADDGSLDWPSFMNPGELVRRAERLRAVGLLDSALDTLAEVSEEHRDFRWRLVSAQVLTASGRGEQALAVVEGVGHRSRAEESELEWRRASAALEASRARSGRRLTEQQRAMMRARAHSHLDRVIELGLDPARSKIALRIQFEDALDSDRFEEALALLRRLQSLDPSDTSGARPLWTRGWKQYQQRNHSGAIGYWTELSELYPTSVYNRSALYWSARAHQVLGNKARATELLKQVAGGPYTDFYARQALRRLGDDSAAPAEATGSTPTEPWPRDFKLARAEQLAAWGLDRAALTELEAVAPPESPAAKALRSSILSAAGEWRQSIIAIKGAYPVLGSPYQGMAPDRAQRLYYPLVFDTLIDQNADRNGLDRNLVLAMIRQESAFDARAHSRAGARGLMQVMPSTGREIARRLGLSYSRERLSDPGFSIRLGTTYYKQVRTMFGEDEELALAGYNAGPYRIKRLWRQAGADPELDRFLESLRLEETKSYVKRVLLFTDSYRRLYPATTAGHPPDSQPAAG